MSGWSCPNESRGTCRHVKGRDCDPGMKGCVLSGKVRFATFEKNTPRIRRLMAGDGRATPAAGRPERS